jgi:transposase
MPAQSDLTDDEWAVLAPLLPAERGRNCRPAHDNRKVLDGILWVAHSGATWRSLPAFYGKWNSVYQRFRRWSQAGVCDAVAEGLGTIARNDAKARVANGAQVYVLRRAAAFKFLTQGATVAAPAADFPRRASVRIRAL